MDDIKAIEMMEQMFFSIANAQKKESGIDYSDDERRDVAMKLRKALDKVVEWYGANKGKKTGEEPLTRFSIYAKLPEIDVKVIAGIEQYKTPLVAILDDFNNRGVQPREIEIYFDSYIDKIKNGWTKKLDDMKKKGG